MTYIFSLCSLPNRKIHFCKSKLLNEAKRKNLLHFLRSWSWAGGVELKIEYFIEAWFSSPCSVDIRTLNWKRKNRLTTKADKKQSAMTNVHNLLLPPLPSITLEIVCLASLCLIHFWADDCAGEFVVFVVCESKAAV